MLCCFLYNNTNYSFYPTHYVYIYILHYLYSNYIYFLYPLSYTHMHHVYALTSKWRNSPPKWITTVKWSQTAESKPPGALPPNTDHFLDPRHSASALPSPPAFKPRGALQGIYQFTTYWQPTVYLGSDSGLAASGVVTNRLVFAKVGRIQEVLVEVAGFRRTLY